MVFPDHGARILLWEHEGRQLIRWPDDADWSKYKKIRGGDPVLFPFVARHYVDGTNELWRDAAGTVRPMPQHGFASGSKFTVVDDPKENCLRMRLTDSDETRKLYPFGFQFDVIVTLLPGSRLEVRFETTNTGDNPLPYYAGHHFYFAVPHDTRGDWTLDLPCTEWGQRGDNGAVVREKAKQELLRLDDPALIDRFQIHPLNAEVTLRNNQTRQEVVLDLEHLGSAPWYAVTTWSETPTSDFYCVEPWLGLPNAIHHGEGLRWVAPGEMETATLVLDGSNW